MVEQNGVKFETWGGSSTYMGYFWPCSIQGHDEVIRCTFNFWAKFGLNDKTQ